MLPRQQALRCFRRRSHFPSLQFGPADFPASNILCSPDNRLCRVFGAAITLRPCNSALRTFRRRTSYAPLTTGSAEFSAQQSLCAPAIRPCGLSGVEHLMLPRQQALRCFRRRSHFPSLQFGPADFPASNILCSPDNRLCRVFGAAITLRPPCRLFGHRHGMLPRQQALRTFRRRTSYAPLTTGSAEFSAQQSLCAPAIRPCGLSGVEHLMLP